ncbi:hypothetical protein [Shewanella sp.]|uniref:hypothetical protein n=1 Tax=Shewanella sp. TaxID=50422 RepID=UPI00405467B4
MDIQQIAQVLLQWGPAGAVAVLIIIVESKLRARWDSVKGKERRMCAWLYLGNWVFIASLLMVVSYHWSVEQLGQKKTGILMSGIVLDLNTNLKVNNTIRTLYTRNELSHWLKNVHWHYTGDKLPSHFAIRIEDDITRNFYDYQLPLDKITDLRDVQLLYQGKKLWLKTPSRNLELVVSHSAAGELDVNAALPLRPSVLSPSHPFFSLISQAHAAEEVDISLVMQALEADDSYIRQFASQYLVDNIVSLTPIIEQTLLKQGASIGVQLGLVTALARASSADLGVKDNWHVSGAVQLKIAELAFSDNTALAAQAKRFLIRNVSAQTYLELQAHCELSAVKDTPKAARCAYLLFDTAYNLAIAQWLSSQYLAEDDELAQVKNAINLLQSNSDLWRFSGAETQVQFAKNDYGIALLSHETAKLYQLRQDPQAQMQYQQQALESFKHLIDFIALYDESHYDYPHHILQAKCYINSPAQACFDLYISE